MPCAVHRLEGHTGGIEALNSLLQDQGFLFNSEGGLTKVGAPQALLRVMPGCKRRELRFCDC